MFFGIFKRIYLEISCRGPWLKKSEGSYASSYGPGRFSDFLAPHMGPSWTRDWAHPGPGTGLSLDQARGTVNTVVWGPYSPHVGTHFCLGPLQSPSGDPFYLGPIRVPFGGPFGGRRPTFWRPKADILEAEGRLNGGLGAEPPGIKKSKKPVSV